MAGYMGGVRRGALGGMSQLAQALAQGPQTERAAYDAEMGLQSKVAQALAQIRQADAGTAKTDAETAFLQNRPGLYEEQAALSAGVDIPTLRAFRQTVQTGQAPQVPMGPETADGEMGVGSMQFDPTQAQRISQALQRMVPVIASGAPIAANDWASASDKYRDQDLSNEILAGTRAPEAVGRAQAAMAGKPLYSGDGMGQVVDLFKGAADASGPAAQGRLQLTQAQAEAQRAAAAENAAQAALARARAAEVSGGDARKPPPGYRFKADGTLEAIPGGPADPKVKREGRGTGAMSPTLQKELLEADDAVQGTKSAIGALTKALELNKSAYSGPLAAGRAMVRSNIPLGDTSTADNTVLLDNIMTGQALEMLKATFGAAPTEGERKILMDLQASSGKTPAQREAIIQRAIAAAQRRGVYSANKAQAIRDGTYLDQGIAAPEAAAPAAAAAPAGGGWKIERVN